jgi:hypothetical protein
LATPDNIATLVEKLKNADPDDNTTVILELFGNSTFRYRQFDGTMALPFKASNGYHLEGEVGVCEDDVFLKLVATTKDLFDAIAPCVKIVVPPLPRHLYNPCCNNRKHCTNFKSEGYELKLLHSTTHFRPLLKDSISKMGVGRFFVLDGIGGLLGIPAGENRGAAAEIVRELKNYCGSDGVHYTETGLANFARTAISAMEGVRSGSLTKSGTDAKGISGKQSSGSYFWRGFISPIGHAGGKADRQPEQYRGGAALGGASGSSQESGAWYPGRGRGGGGRGRWGQLGSRHDGQRYHEGHGHQEGQDLYRSFSRGGRRGQHGLHHHPYY